MYSERVGIVMSFLCEHVSTIFLQRFASNITQIRSFNRIYALCVNILSLYNISFESRSRSEFTRMNERKMIMVMMMVLTRSGDAANIESMCIIDFEMGFDHSTFSFAIAMPRRKQIFGINLVL